MEEDKEFRSVTTYWIYSANNWGIHVSWRVSVRSGFSPVHSGCIFEHSGSIFGCSGFGVNFRTLSVRAFGVQTFGSFFGYSDVHGLFGRSGSLFGVQFFLDISDPFSNVSGIGGPFQS